MIVEVRAGGPFQENGYVLACEDTREAVLVDPGDSVAELLEYAARDYRRGVVTLFRTSGTGDPVYILRPRGLDAGRTYRVTFCNREQTAELSGTVLMRDGIAVRLEDHLTSEMVLFDSRQ